jgi:hypothetical protein
VVDLEWRDLPAGAVAFVHLLGPARADGGTVWALDDVPLQEMPAHRPGAAAPRLVRHVLDIPPDMPPGRYELEMGLYDAATGQRLEPDALGSDADGVAGPVPGEGAADGRFRLDAGAKRVILTDYEVDAP